MSTTNDEPVFPADPEWPRLDPVCWATTNGTPYLREPGVVLVSKPSVNTGNLAVFMDSYDPTLHFEDYLQDPSVLPAGEQLCKTMGQLCYLSFGPQRSKNNQAARYFDNILESGHGSVLEHANYSFVFYGISRSLTHELVRHRAGFAFSQVSQRYVDGTKLRFVMRPEFLPSRSPELAEMFYDDIDQARLRYDQYAERLLQSPDLEQLRKDRMSRTDLRKRVNQVARGVLPNFTEAPIGVTANVRAWRHFCNMRGSVHAESEIRRLTVMVAKCLKVVAPLLFADVSLVTLKDGTMGLQVGYPKV